MIGMALLALLELQDPPAAPPPAAAYELRTVQGWTAHVSSALLHDGPLAAEVLELLDHQLYQLRRALPPAAVARLQQVPFWVELADHDILCMCYHVSADWLGEHGYLREKAGGVEIGNARAFLDWSREQPWMALHELAHAWYWQMLGGHDEGVQGAYDAALASGVYERVLHTNGSQQRHYALTNPDEYFAELTEAYFGCNDFYPFVHAELTGTDARGEQAVAAAWARAAAPAPPGS